MRFMLFYNNQIELYVGLARPDDIEVLGKGGSVDAPVGIPYKNKIIENWPDFSFRPDQKATLRIGEDLSEPIVVVCEMGEKKLSGDYGILLASEEFERLRQMEPTNEFELSWDNCIGTRFGMDKISMYIMEDQDK